jgi:hypothetical protein
MFRLFPKGFYVQPHLPIAVPWLFRIQRRGFWEILVLFWQVDTSNLCESLLPLGKYRLLR